MLRDTSGQGSASAIPLWVLGQGSNSEEGCAVGNQRPRTREEAASGDLWGLWGPSDCKTKPQSLGSEEMGRA